MRPLEDVLAFHEKFELPRGGPPRLLTNDELDFRLRFLIEEMEEYRAAHQRGDLAECLDALVDLVYVALGTAIFHGFDAVADEGHPDAGRRIFEVAWARVQGANMAKVRGASDGSDSKRRSPFDVVKPEGWTAPNHDDLLEVTDTVTKRVGDLELTKTHTERRVPRFAVEDEG